MKPENKRTIYDFLAFIFCVSVLRGNKATKAEESYIWVVIALILLTLAVYLYNELELLGYCF